MDFNGKKKLGWNGKIKIALLLTFIAGGMLGHGMGARDQYHTIEKYLIQEGQAGHYIEIQGNLYHIEKVDKIKIGQANPSNSTIIQIENPGGK